MHWGMGLKIFVGETDFFHWGEFHWVCYIGVSGALDRQKNSGNRRKAGVSKMAFPNQGHRPKLETPHRVFCSPTIRGFMQEEAKITQ